MNLIIYFCTIISIVLIVLVAYYLTNASRNARPRRLAQATRRYDALLATCVASGAFCLPKREIKRLRRTINLEAFYRACKRLGQDDLRRVLLDNQAALIDLQLREKSTTVRAYFAYVLRDLGGFDDDEGGYGELMLRFLYDDSVYTRENALKAIYGFGDARLVERALTGLSERGISHNEKLVADGLLTFRGDDGLLAELLMSHYDELLECYRNALINYLSHKEIDTYDDVLREEARSQGVSLDTACAIIRKINKSPSAQNCRFLEEVVARYEDGDSWEPVAVAATGLGRCGKDDKAKGLLKGLVTSRNWHIRRNAAAALVSLGLTKEDMDEIHARQDRFATDAIAYELERLAYA